MAQEEPKLDELEECQKKAEEYLNGWKRERADFLNYKKAEMERLAKLAKYANEDLVLKILPILDNFYLAEKHLPENKEFTDGFMQIKKQLSGFLSKEGIEHIEVLNKPFDPATMESVEEVAGHPMSGDSGHRVSGSVIKEVQRGYKMHGKLIRPAKVKISK